MVLISCQVTNKIPSIVCKLSEGNIYKLIALSHLKSQKNVVYSGTMGYWESSIMKYKQAGCLEGEASALLVKHCICFSQYKDSNMSLLE